MTRLSSSPGKPVQLFAINVGTLAVFVAWLVAAGYALMYLVSH